MKFIRVLRKGKMVIYCLMGIVFLFGMKKSFFFFFFFLVPPPVGGALVVD